MIHLGGNCHVLRSSAYYNADPLEAGGSYEENQELQQLEAYVELEVISNNLLLINEILRLLNFHVCGLLDPLLPVSMGVSFNKLKVAF